MKSKKAASTTEDSSSSSSNESSSSSSGSDSSSSDSESSQEPAPKQTGGQKKVVRTRVSSTNSSSDCAPKKQELKKRSAKPPIKKKPAPPPAKVLKKPPAKTALTKKQQQPSSANDNEANNKSPKLHLKMRSIFSPENSSLSSDSSEVTKDNNEPTNSKKERINQSFDVSDSDAELNINGTATTNHSKSKGPRARVQPRSVARKSSDSEGDNVQAARKLTRSSSARIRKSKHVVGKVSDSDSETEAVGTGSGNKSSATGKRKPAAGSASAKGKSSSANPNRKSTNKDTSSYSSAPSSQESCHTPTVEERKCPMAGCDSTGHLNGKSDRHLSLQACPSYHNLTMTECVNLRQKSESQLNHWSIIATSKQEFPVRTARSPRATGPTNEQVKELQRVRQQRSQMSERKEFDSSLPLELSGDAEDKWREREPNLTGITSDFDLELFRASQAEASFKYEEELKSLPLMCGLRFIEMGRFEMEVWYQSPYPDDLARLAKLYLCEFCLVYMRSRTILRRHAAKCVWRHPPGDEIYRAPFASNSRKEKVSVWEVDGQKQKTYCQNLCLLAKCFLDTKTLYYDVEPFLFYVMTVADSEGCHSVGYFSKEKDSFLNYNVSCIMTLPPYQRQGYGRLLIDFSYLLTRTEGKIGSPEKPLSDLGLISYRSYWKDVLLEHVCSYPGKEISVKDLSQEMAINAYDIVSTLQALGMMKYWKGKHIVLKKRDVIEEYQERARRRGPDWRHTDPKYLRWRPFVLPEEPAS